MRPWAKFPTDLPYRPALRRVQPQVRWTFACCFVVAREATPPGYVLDEHGRPMSLRQLGSYVGIHHNTVGRHLDRLLLAGLLVRDLGARLLLPDLVPAAIVTPDGAPAEVLGAVDNQLALPPPGGSPEREIAHGEPPSSLLEDQKRELRSTDGLAAAVENPQGYAIDLAPVLIADPDARYLLGKLVEASGPWRRACSEPRDRRNLVRLHAEHPAAFVEALRHQALTPTARNPLAWLNTAVADLAEVAS